MRHAQLLLLGMTGCAAVGLDYEAPSIEAPSAYGDRESQSVATDQIATWWEGLGDEQLSQLVDVVLESNLDLAAAIERVEVSRATYGVVASQRFPAVDAVGSYGRARPFGGVTQNQWTVGGRASWEIDVFGRVRRSIEASLASFEAEVEDLNGVRVAVAAEAAATYLQILSLHERLGIAARNVAGQERSLGIATQRFDAGMSAGLDPAQARVNLHSTQASVPTLELQLSRALHRLSVLTGQNPRALIGQLSTERVLPSVPDELLVGIPADLLRNRPDIRSLERRLAAQSAQVGVATASLYPAIELSGSWDWLSRTPGALFDSGTGFGNIGPLVSIPIFNAGRLRAQVSAEEAAMRQLDKQLRQRVLIAQEEVENALVAIVRDRRQSELLVEAVAAAKQSVDLSKHLYTSGQSDFQNVLDAQRSLFALEDDLARAKLATLLDVVDLYRAVGGGWGSGDQDREAGSP